VETDLGLTLPVLSVMGGASLLDLTRELLERFTASRLGTEPGGDFEEIEL
jgi:hypothetical protein